jgi:hypothetical protein
MEKDQLNILWTNADPVTAELIEHSWTRNCRPVGKILTLKGSKDDMDG